MKKVAVITLVCANVLLLALVLTRTMPRAFGQTMRGGSNYLLLTGQLEADYDAVYVVDMASRRLAAWKLDRGTKKLTPFQGRNLANDVRRR
jgi:hypothetical protein